MRFGKCVFVQLGLRDGLDTLLAVIGQLFAGGVADGWHLRSGEVLEFLEEVGFRHCAGRSPFHLPRKLRVADPIASCKE